jgi:hypothetical protein
MGEHTDAQLKVHLAAVLEADKAQLEDEITTATDGCERDRIRTDIEACQFLLRRLNLILVRNKVSSLRH